MDKISSILPTSARVKSVDLSEAPPVRPGAPTNGRPEGRNSIRDRVTLSDNAKDLALKETLVYKNPKDTARAKMVEEVSRKFFETRLNPVAVDTSAAEKAADISDEDVKYEAPVATEKQTPLTNSEPKSIEPTEAE